MKKTIISISLVIFLIIFIIICFVLKKDNKEIDNKTENINNNIIQNNEISNNIMTDNKVDEIMNTVCIKINNQVFNIDLENNSATIELKERLKNGDIVVNAHEYGGFEKVGDLGFSLTREDSDITTSAGDIVLYQGNQISLFYDSNSWSYTKLGRIHNIATNELKNILGKGDVTIIFTLN